MPVIVLTKEQLYGLVESEIPDNNNNLIQASNARLVFYRMIDSLMLETTIGGGSVYFQKSTNVTAVGTNTGIPFITGPLGNIEVVVNGETFIVENTINDKFFVKNSIGVLKTIGTISNGDILHYNSTALGWSITNDEIIIKYEV